MSDTRDNPFKPLILNLLRQAQEGQNAFFAELSPEDLAAHGEPVFWSAKDHVAHMTFWRRRLIDRLRAIVQGEPQPQSQDFSLLNPLIFAEQRDRSWPEILAESDQAYGELIQVTAQLTEEDLTDWNRFDWMPDGEPLYVSYMGNCYEHTQNHLAQYLYERGNTERAVEIYGVWATQVVESPAASPHLKSLVLYNRACFDATHGRIDSAIPALQEAFTLHPPYRLFAETDPDLSALRPFSFA